VSIPNTTLNVSMQFMLTNTFLMPGVILENIIRQNFMDYWDSQVTMIGKIFLNQDMSKKS
jgi:hypothetical protein